jgi:hypothetical protein
MLIAEGWKLLDSLILSLRSKPLESFYPAMCLLRLMQAARRASRPRRLDHLLPHGHHVEKLNTRSLGPARTMKKACARSRVLGMTVREE